MITDAPVPGAYAAEVRHFDDLVDRTGESWWGHSTAAGRRRLARRADILARSMPLGPRFHVMEIAAGAGALTQAVLTREPQARITATDISPASVRRLRERVSRFPNVHVEIADITALPHGSGSFDGVIGNSALHHVDVGRCAAELHRVLKPCGRLIIFEPNLLNPEVGIETFAARRFATRRLDYSADERTHTRWTYARILRQAGFRKVRVRPFDFLHPATPAPAVRVVSAATRIVEQIAFLREFSGSLVIEAHKSA